MIHFYKSFKMNLLPNLIKLIIQKLAIYDVLNLRLVTREFKTLTDNTFHPFYKKFKIIEFEKACKRIFWGLPIDTDIEMLIKEYQQLEQLPSLGLMTNDELFDKMVWNQSKGNCQYEWITDEHRANPNMYWDERDKMYFIMK